MLFYFWNDISWPCGRPPQIQWKMIPKVNSRIKHQGPIIFSKNLLFNYAPLYLKNTLPILLSDKVHFAKWPYHWITDKQSHYRIPLRYTSTTKIAFFLFFSDLYGSWRLEHTLKNVHNHFCNILFFARGYKLHCICQQNSIN